MAAPMTSAGGAIEGDHSVMQSAVESAPKKKGRTNTPWTAEEEQRLKTMRDAGRSWSEIAKVRAPSRMCHAQLLAYSNAPQTFPTRTEGSVKKHWYKVRLYVCPRWEYLLTLRVGYALC